MGVRCRGTRPERACPSEEGLTLSADTGALHQVLGHLLDNAVKYSPPHGVITVLASGTPGRVAIAVVDQGVGLPEGMDVFEAFQRGDAAHIGLAPGIGLGLHIVCDLVGAMGGSVTAVAIQSWGRRFSSASLMGMTEDAATLGLAHMQSSSSAEGDNRCEGSPPR